MYICVSQWHLFRWLRWHIGFTQKLLHREVFAHRSLYNLLYAEDFTQRHFYTEELIHTEAFTLRSLYTRTRELLNTVVFTQKSFYMERGGQMSVVLFCLLQQKPKEASWRVAQVPLKGWQKQTATSELPAARQATNDRQKRLTTVWCCFPRCCIVTWLLSEHESWMTRGIFWAWKFWAHVLERSES